MKKKKSRCALIKHRNTIFLFIIVRSEFQFCSLGSALKPLKAQWPLYVSSRLNKFHVLPTERIYALCGSENKQRLFPYTALTDWFL